NLLFLAAVIFLFAGFAWAEERILNFASAMNVNPDGSVTVQEKITVNVEHIKIRRGLYRDIPNSSNKPVQFISLYMDNSPHPAFTERAGRNLRINFGNDDYISKGIHTYRLIYSIANVVKGFDDYDEIYWNVTGNDWDFTIERASFLINLPEGADIKNDLVSTYTGYRGSKNSNAVRVGNNFFATTQPLRKGEGFTVAVPFTKGIVKAEEIKDSKSALTNLPSQLSGIAIAAAIVLFVILMAYMLISWFAVGKDPNDIIVTQFTPPPGISPAFIRLLWKRGFDQKVFATALVSLIMKEKIELIEERVVYVKTAVLKIKDRDTSNLSEEEKFIIETLFRASDRFAINQSNWLPLSSCINQIEKGFKIEKKKYIVSNRQYIIPAIIALILFQILLIPAAAMAALPLIFINLHYSIFFIVAVSLPKSKTMKTVFFIALNLFYSVFFIGLGSAAGGSAMIIEACFILSLWAFLVYFNIMDNLTEEGRELFKHIKGFYRYMTVAERNRVELSVPIDTEKIFADYLPYAFAFDIENKWMKRFENTLSRATIEHYTNNIVGRSVFAGGLLLSSINSAAPRSNGHSGSGGGGSSGGGSGGGGGGGR
ncbi:MAG: DUF2207 domain-containing protein, partial [Firmicutes bacterium]|nr:DUF2207 domain-containing protein [Bacillota bacterium]